VRADPPNPRRRGFTVVELLLVIGVMFLLSSMAIPGITRSLRVATVTGAVASIQGAASASQNMAMNLLRSEGQAYPGVVIAQRDGRWAVASVVVAATGAASVGLAQALTDEEGRPSVQVMSPNVTLWLGDSPATPTDTIAWFYEPSTGRVVIPKAGGFSAPGAMVGYQPPQLTGAGGERLVFGARVGGTDLNVLAPPTATSPGLSLRSRDQRTKRSVVMQPSGTMHIQEF